MAAESLLRQEGAPIRVLLLEPNDVGGVVGTVHRDGWLVEQSADNFLAARPEGLGLVNRLGLADELIPVNEPARRALVYSAGRTLPVPAGFRLMAPALAKGILESDILSPAGKARLLDEANVAPAIGGGDESLESFAVRRLGREAFDRLVQPLVAGIWTADPARLSMTAACPEFLDMERVHGSLIRGEEDRLRRLGDSHQGIGARYGQFVTLASGMGTLPARLMEWLTAAGMERRRMRAESIERLADGRWQVVASERGLPATLIAADGVVVAVPAPAAAGVLRGVDETLAADLAGIEYAGSVVVVVGFSRDDVAHPLDAAGLVVPRIEGRGILAVSFSSSKFPGRAPEGCVLLRVFVGGALDPARALLDDEKIVALVEAELSDMLGVRGKPRLVQIARWPSAMPQYHLGHCQRLSRITERLNALPGLGLAGAAYEGVGIPQVIASGQAAAQRAGAAVQGMNRRTDWRVIKRSGG